ncbi:MAG: ABC transporter ATP-binding protein [Lachnospiraceae bacterium]|nr:ABC transporter ATP-binding protein [Lachnospiraceae bacterium]
MTDFIKTESLNVGYNKKPVIEDISLSIKKGEIVSLIGPNGAGKTTILKSITKHLPIVGGVVFIDKDDIEKTSFKDLAKKLAVVLTDRMKPELMTCFDVVSTGRYPYTGKLGQLTAEDERIVEEAMEKVKVLELSERDFSAISDGQRQRVLLARAICQMPEAIVLDEPTSFLDVKHKLKLLGILREMAKEKNITVLMSLHEIDLAMKISDKIICVKDNHVAGFGTADELFNDGFIKDLYDIDDGSFDTVFGSVEMPKPAGEVKTFVISGCGTGIKLFRNIQKQQTPFYCGIIFENDLDFIVARQLAEKVVTSKPFEEISDAAFNEAKELLLKCDKLIVTDFEMTGIAGRNADLIKAAEGAGIEIVRI